MDSVKQGRVMDPHPFMKNKLHLGAGREIRAKKLLFKGGVWRSIPRGISAKLDNTKKEMSERQGRPPSKRGGGCAASFHRLSGGTALQEPPPLVWWL